MKPSYVLNLDALSVVMVAVTIAMSVISNLGYLLHINIPQPSKIWLSYLRPCSMDVTT